MIFWSQIVLTTGEVKVATEFSNFRKLHIVLIITMKQWSVVTQNSCWIPFGCGTFGTNCFFQLERRQLEKLCNGVLQLQEASDY